MYERDRHTDRQTHTPHDSIGRARLHSIARQKRANESERSVVQLFIHMS